MSGSQTLTKLDPRLVRVRLQVNDTIREYNEDFYIRAKGCKYANPIQNECSVSLGNLDKATRNYILTETSPFNANKTPKVFSLYAGRVSTGLFLVYSGDITTSQISQPPDINLTIKAGTKHFSKGKVGHRSGGKTQMLGDLSKGVAINLGLSLNNQARDRTIGNYTHNGNALDEVSNLQDFGVDAFVDDDTLVVKEHGVALQGELLVLSEQSGMIGVPEVTEKGLKVIFLYDNAAKLGGAIQIISNLNPSANGLYVIYKLNFAISSRETEFYYIAECLKAKT